MGGVAALLTQLNGPRFDSELQCVSVCIFPPCILGFSPGSVVSLHLLKEPIGVLLYMRMNAVHSATYWIEQYRLSVVYFP